MSGNGEATLSDLKVPDGLDLSALLSIGDRAIAEGLVALDAALLRRIGLPIIDVLISHPEAEAIGLGALVLRARALSSGTQKTYSGRYRKACLAAGYDRLPDNLRRRAMYYPILSGDARLGESIALEEARQDRAGSPGLFRLGAVADRTRETIAPDYRIDWLPFGMKWGP